MAILVALARSSVLGIPIVQDSAQNTGAILSKPVDCRSGGILRGFARPNHKDYPIGKASDHAENR